MLLRAPGVYRPQDDTGLLTEVIVDSGMAVGRRVLDVGTGSGALALAAARAGAAEVTAVDLSLRSVLATRLNSRLHGLRVRVRRGDLFAPVAGERFDLVVANPPYVPSPMERLPRHAVGRCWDGGPDGRAVVDRICRTVPRVLADGGRLVMVHSAVSGTDATLAALAEAGLTATVLARATVPFGPVMRARAAHMHALGLVAPDEDVEELVVIGAHHAA
ncbi:HemK2/MTQ2 family protein methyltransferase [Pseudonocardia zijingensis]|uniref:Methyltransferase n=1 Tax=Pseudonocardia zijingensis TaxID=153376 RepID=A0ABP3YN22_9PSEU